MKTALKKASNSVIYDRIKTIRISASARSQALRRLQWAEQATATILRVAHVLRLLVAMPNLKPTFKHQA
jgi:hypothetical protein